MNSPRPLPADSAVDFDALFRQYSQELNDFAFRRVRDRETAADVVQDGFERFLRWMRTSDRQSQPNSPRFFLWTIVGNLSLDVIVETGHRPLKRIPR